MLLRIVLASMAMLLAGACTSAAVSTPTAPQPTLAVSPTSTPVPTPTPVDDTQAREAAAALGAFGRDADVLVVDWDAFRVRFDDWRDSIESCGEADRRADLRGWVVDFGAVSLAAASLDFPSGSAAARDSLVNAIILEEGGLRELRDGWTPGSDAAFALYERARTQAVIGRQEARARVVELIAIGESGDPAPELEPSPPPPPGIPPGFLPPEPPPAPLADEDTLVTFKGELEASWVSWDEFHLRFDAWRRTDGDCPQSDVRDRLSAFARDFDAVLARANALVRPSVVRPLAEQLIEAAVLESEALAGLRDAWTAYDAGPWSALDATRRGADGLRRQVRSSVDELNLQYGISAS